MKVFNLQCGLGHGFEGWFSAEVDFQNQLARGLLQCPLCGDASITKGLSAPRLNLSSSSSPTPSSSAPSLPEQPRHKPAAQQTAEASLDHTALQNLWVHLSRHVIQNTENVGERFSQEVRKMHYGEAPTRGVRGYATPKQASELLDEGIDVMPLPVPDSLKGPLQ